MGGAIDEGGWGGSGEAVRWLERYEVEVEVEVEVCSKGSCASVDLEGNGVGSRCVEPLINIFDANVLFAGTVSGMAVEPVLYVSESYPESLTGMRRTGLQSGGSSTKRLYPGSCSRRLFNRFVTYVRFNYINRFKSLFYLCSLLALYSDSESSSSSFSFF